MTEDSERTVDSGLDSEVAAWFVGSERPASQAQFTQSVMRAVRAAQLRSRMLVMATVLLALAAGWLASPTLATFASAVLRVTSSGLTATAAVLASPFVGVIGLIVVAAIVPLVRRPA